MAIRTICFTDNSVDSYLYENCRVHGIIGRNIPLASLQNAFYLVKIENLLYTEFTGNLVSERD